MLHGIENVEWKWFSEYLKGRSQIVRHNGVSQAEYVTAGVPQGSVLGPCLFTVFINDLSQFSGDCTCNLYADDAVIYCHDSSNTRILQKLRDSVSSVSEWYSANKLALNAQKCEVMVLKTKRCNASDCLDIVLNDVHLNQVNCAKYLGLNIDQNLSWNEYISCLCSKISLKLQCLNRLKASVPSEVLDTIYSSTIQPCIDYAISVWGNTCDYNLDKIQRLQNFAARIVLRNFDYINFRGINLVKELKWMNVRERCSYFTGILMFKCVHGLAPDYLINEIDLYSDVNERESSRNNHQLHVYVPICSSQSFKYCGAILWNNLPNDLKQSPSLSVFKQHLKLYICG